MEVDLTGPSPVKKLKQPRLSFGPVKKDGEENSKKRKISNEENTPNKKGKPEDNSETKVETTPLKSANIVNKSPVKNKPEVSSKTKSILSTFASKGADKSVDVESKDTKNVVKDSTEKVDKRKNNRDIKPKKKAKVEDNEDEVEDKDTSEKKPGSIKMPWTGKKGKEKKAEKQEVLNIDDNSADFFEMNDEDDDVVITEEKEVEEEHEEDEENDEELEDELAWLKKDNEEEDTPVSLSPRKKRGRKSASAPKEEVKETKSSSADKTKSKTPSKDEAKPKTPSTQRRKSIKATTPKLTPEEKEQQAKMKSAEKAEKEKQRVEEKERKEKEKKEEKERKEREKVEEKEAKERRKSLAKEEKEKAKADSKLEKEKLESEEKEKEKAKAPVPINESPLFKFLVKSKPGPIPPKPVKTAKTDDDDIEVLEVVPGETKNDAPIEKVQENGDSEKSETDNSEAPSTPVRASPRKNAAASTPKVGELSATEEMKTPVRSSPRKKSGMTPTIASMFKTPKGPVTPKLGTPKSAKLGTPKSATTPVSGNQEETKKLSIAKIKVQIITLNDDIDTAVADKDFLKAHELKLKITGLEEEMKKLEDGSPCLPSLPSVKQVSPKTPQGSGRPVSVKTPGSGTPGSSPGSSEKKMTPKQIAYREELRKKREEKEREKEIALEEKKKKQAELKAEKEREKEEKERQKEIEKRVKEVERLEKEREKEKERKEKEAQKELERKQREEEKAKKKAELEEARLLKQKEKEEEKKKMEEEKKKAEEAEKEKQAKTAQAFKGFFVKKDVQEVEKKAETEEISQMEEGGNFTPFRLKRDMRMAPLVRNDPVLAKMRIDSLESPSGPSGLYLEILKTGEYQPKNGQSRTWPLEAKNVQEIDDDIEILNDDEEESEVDEDEEAEKVIEEKPFDKTYKRAKLFQFHENQRPAYWGTWTKKHEKIKGRTPFARDDVIFDYDYDSDEDWEEEEQGESLSDDDEKDKEEEDDYEVDNKFFVPHGYLSDEEEDKDEDEVFNPDTAKEKLKLKEEEFAAEQKKKTKTIKPHIWGCHWEEEEVDTSAAAAQLIKILSPYSCIIIGNNNEEPIDTTFTKSSSPEGEVKEDEVKGRGRPGGKRSFPEEAMVDLIKLIHANPNSKVFLTKEFIEFWKKTSGGDTEATTILEGAVGTPATPVGCPISKKCTVEKIVEVADYKKIEELGDKSGRFWVVKPEILEKYAVTPTFPNDWNYILEPPKQNVNLEEGGVSRPDSPTGGAKNQPPNPASLITKFTKILTEEERAKNLAKPATPLVPVVAAVAPPEVQGIGKFAVKLTEEEHQKKMATPIEVKKTPGSAKVTPIAVKKTPGSAKQAATETSSSKKKAGGIEKFMGAKASPIAVKKTPTSKTATPTSKTATPTGETTPKTNHIAVKKTPGSKTTTPKANQIAVKKTPGSKTTTPKANQIAVKKTPGSKTTTPKANSVKKAQSVLPAISTTPKANPIAIKKTPKTGTPKSVTTPKGGRRISLTPVRNSPRKKSGEVEPMDVECITVD